MATPLSYQSYTPGKLTPIPQDAAGYDGTGAGLVTAGSASGSTEVFMRITAIADITDANIVRVFTKLSSTMIFEYAVKLIKRATLDPDTVSQFFLDLPMIRLTGTGHEIYISQEQNDTNLVVKFEKRNLGF